VIEAHIAAGAAALTLAPLVLWLVGAGDDHRGLLTAYHGAVLVVCGTAAVLVVREPARLWWLAPLAALTAVLVVLAHRRPRRLTRTGLRLRVHARGGTVIALLTATLVVSLDGTAEVVSWVLPTVVGVWLIERWYQRAAQDRTGVIE
jgi:hypothetical protein